MNKLFTKIGTAMVGIAMAIGVGVAVGRDGFKEVKAAIDGPTSNWQGNAVADGWSVYKADGTAAVKDTNYKLLNGKDPEGKYIQLVGGSYVQTNSSILIDNKYTVSVGLKVGTYGNASGNSRVLTIGLYNNLGTLVSDTQTIEGANKYVPDNYVSKTLTTTATEGSQSVYIRISSDSAATTGTSARLFSTTSSYTAPSGNIKPLTITAKQSNETVIPNEGSYPYTGVIGSSSEVQFKVSATYEPGSGYVDGSQFAWTSSNTDVATITASGNVVTALIKEKGTTTITVATSDASGGNDNISTSFTLDTTGASYAKGHAENPYNVADFITDYNTISGKDVYVTGYIAKKDNSNYAYISDVRGDDENDLIELYDNSVVFASGISSSDYIVGAKVVAHGYAAKFNSTYEIKFSGDDHVTVTSLTTSAELDHAEALAFENAYVKRDIEYPDSTPTGVEGTACLSTSKGGSGYYDTAIEEYGKLVDSTKVEFSTHADFAKARERMIAWAAANGKTLVFNQDGSLGITTKSAGFIGSYVNNANNGFATVIIIASVIATLTVAGIFLLKKKEEK